MARRVFALGLLLGLLAVMFPQAAAAGTVRWSRVEIPAQGKAGGWVLAYGWDTGRLAVATDGSLYAHIYDGGTDRLLRSGDGGGSWVETGYQGGAITAIVCPRSGANTIYVADERRVYRSDDAGVSFRELGSSSLPALSTNEVITCLDVTATDDDTPVVFIGTADADGGEAGGIYFLLATDFAATWTDLQADYDIYALACSPDFGDSYQTVALVSDETRTYIVKNNGIPGNWPHPVELLEGGTTSIAAAAADICFRADYALSQELFVGVSASGQGNVYRVVGGNAFDTGLDTDIVSLAAYGTGDGGLLAGGAAGGVWFSPDGGQTGTPSRKGLSGEGPVRLVAAGSGLVYGTSAGTEGGLSASRDNGVTWNQLSLVNTRISDIIDLAPSPEYERDGTLFLLTYNTGGEHSLWRSAAGRWERVCVSSLPGIDQIQKVALSPDYGRERQVVYLAGTASGGPALWQSADNGQGFMCQALPFAVDTWAPVDDTTFIIGGYNGSQGLVCATYNSGLTFTPPVAAGGQSLNALVLSPGYSEDGTLLVGNRDGWVYLSQDRGASFTPLPAEAITKPLSGNITVAFDPEYSRNQTVYAASDTVDGGIYRFVLGGSGGWENIDSPTGGRMGQVVMGEGGTLYAANLSADGGMERGLDPGYPLGPVFESVTAGLADGATLNGLWRSGDQLWSIDSSSVQPVTYADTLMLPVTLVAPDGTEPGLGTIFQGTVRSVTLDWEALSGATEYRWQLDDDTDFSSVPSGFEGSTASSQAQPPPLEPATRYYWRVRATQPVLSPWSAKWSFTTSLGPETVAPRLESPAAGAGDVPVDPIFQWSALAGAEGYELMVAADASFNSPVIMMTGTLALPATAWQPDASLEADTTYYWKVRAVGSGTGSPWSVVSAFTTLAALSPAAATPQPPVPAAADNTELPDWLWPWGVALLLALLAIMVAILVTMIVLVSRVLKSQKD